jgi:hypothetical protein
MLSCAFHGIASRSQVYAVIDARGEALLGRGHGYHLGMLSLSLLARLFSPLIAALCIAAPPSRPDAPASSRWAYPFAHDGHAPACPPVEIDCLKFREGVEWGVLAKSLVETWYPRLCELLATEGLDPIDGKPHGKAFTSPRSLRIVIERELKVPAYTTGSEIHVNGSWIAKHPEDSGLLIHELAHVVQSYPQGKSTPGWLVEGIADYVRWWRYEPELAATSGRTRIDPAKSKYTDSYRTTAMWLAWCSRTHDMRLVPALDFAARNGEDPLPVFEKLCGKDAQALWQDFVAEQH